MFEELVLLNFSFREETYNTDDQQEKNMKKWRICHWFQHCYESNLQILLGIIYNYVTKIQEFKLSSQLFLSWLISPRESRNLELDIEFEFEFEFELEFELRIEIFSKWQI